MKAFFIHMVCVVSFKTIHLQCVKNEEGIRCIHCGYFVDKYSAQADMHAGGGW